MGWQAIEHVVVLMQENLSFDRVLGWMRPETDGVDGVPDGVSFPVNSSLFPKGTVLHPEPGAAMIPPGAPHMPWDMAQQLHGKGFVHNAIHYAESQDPLNDEERRALVRTMLQHHRREDLPVYRELAAHYAVADRWFAPLASNTWPNRYFLHMGTSPVGGLPLPELGGKQPTIFDRLTEAGLPWRIYTDGPATLMTSQSVMRAIRRARRKAKAEGVPDGDADPVRDMSRFLCDVSRSSLEGLPPELQGRDLVQPGDIVPLPTYTFIEPRHWPSKRGPANNDHHHTHLHEGQRLVGTIYNALRADPERWARTLFVVTYDEHGGYWDHVAPPAAPHPETGRLGESPTQAALDWYGGRVPALLFSPWVKPGAYSKVCDHTSILAFLERRFGLEPLTERDRQADDLTDAFGTELRATPERVALPGAPPPVEPTGDRDKDLTGMALDLYRHLATLHGVDGEAELARLDIEQIKALGDARAENMRRMLNAVEASAPTLG